MLVQASEWLQRRSDDLSTAEQAFIEASLTLRQRAEKAQRRRMQVVIAGVVVALALAAFAGLQAHIARQNAHTAAINQEKANEQAKLAQERADALERDYMLALTTT